MIVIYLKNLNLKGKDKMVRMFLLFSYTLTEAQKEEASVRFKIDEFIFSGMLFLDYIKIFVKYREKCTKIKLRRCNVPYF